MIRHVSELTVLALAVALNLAQPRSALAWGDEGHEVVALVAQSFLEPDVRKRVSALLAADTSSLTAHDIASEATWADKFRDANLSGSREKTRQWHFADIEITAPNLDAACFNHPVIPVGTPASDGPAPDCVVDKIQEFAAELANPATDLEEQVVALKFVLHFVGDVHQPLHSSDDNDRGGNDKRVSAAGFKAGNLHHFWDTEFVDQLGPDAKTIASDLIGHITKAQQDRWQVGGPTDWAKESFKVAQDDAYGQLPAPNAHGSFRLTEDYVSTATNDVSLQLSKAGVRLAMILNQALRKPELSSR
jgi:nuclease S1